MALSPLAGKPAPADQLIDVDRLLKQYDDVVPDVGDPAPARGVRHERPPRLPRGRLASTRPTSSRRPQAICEYRRAQGTDGPLYLGMDTHAVSAPAQTHGARGAGGPRRRCVLPARRRLHAHARISRAILAWNDGGGSGARRRHRRHAVPQPAAGWRLQVQPAPRRPRRRGRDARRRGTRQRASRGWKRWSEADRLRGGRQGPTTHAHDFVEPVRPGALARSIDMDAIRSAGIRIGADPLGRGQRRVLGADPRALRPRRDRRQPAGRSDVRVHDARPRRPDPDGLLEPVRDGEPHRPEGPVPGGLRQRRRRRPPRDRDAVGGSHEPEPLPGGGHSLPLCPPFRVAGRRRRGQDARQQQPDRQGRRVPRPDARSRFPWASSGSSAGCSTGRWIRWRGERRCELPAQGRRRLDDRQGRHPPRPAGRRDHGRDREGSRRALPGDGGGVRDALLPAGRRPGHPRGEGDPREAVVRPR